MESARKGVYHPPGGVRDEALKSDASFPRDNKIATTTTAVWGEKIKLTAGSSFSASTSFSPPCATSPPPPPPPPPSPSPSPPVPTSPSSVVRRFDGLAATAAWAVLFWPVLCIEMGPPAEAAKSPATEPTLTPPSWIRSPWTIVRGAAASVKAERLLNYPHTPTLEQVNRQQTTGQPPTSKTRLPRRRLRSGGHSVGKASEKPNRRSGDSLGPNVGMVSTTMRKTGTQPSNPGGPTLAKQAKNRTQTSLTDPNAAAHCGR